MRALSHTSNVPWQLEMFHNSLKKQLKLKEMLKLLHDVRGQSCLLITCGDNNGALNWYFRERGGRWLWADVHDEKLAELRELLNEPVIHYCADQFPFADGVFDCVVSIDVLEHLESDQPFLREMSRVLRPQGVALVTVPNGDPSLLANRIKWRVGMTPEVYGHARAGYTSDELKDSMTQAGFVSNGDSGYSRFFTEMVELLINFGYVFVLSRKKGKGESGQIAPTSSGDMKRHGVAYRLYSLVFPLLKSISRLDALLPRSTNNAVIVRAVKGPEAE